MKKNKIEYSVVVPVYNSEKTLSKLIKRLHKTFTSITSSYEIILVDDGSKDNSWQLLEKLHKQDQRVKIIQLMRNFGQHNALMCAFNHVKGNYVITMDDDLQHPPEEIPKLIKAIKKYRDCDVIIGWPKKKEHNLFRNFLSKSANILNSYFYNKPLDLRMGAFRIIKKEIIKELIKNKNPSPTVGPFLLAISLRMKNITVIHKERKFGSTTYTLAKFIKIALDNILHNSTLPLKTVSVFGVIISFVSIALGAYFIYFKLFLKNPLAGWTSLIVVNLFLFGTVLFSLGIIGEYLIRIVRLTNHKRQYLIRKKLL